jgi:hypothetical protein
MGHLMQASPDPPAAPTSYAYLTGLSPPRSDDLFVNSLLTDSLELGSLNDQDDALQFPLESMLTGTQADDSFAPHHTSALTTSGLNDEDPMQF